MSQQLILGHNFLKTFHIRTLWNADDVMSLTRNGMPFAEMLPTHDITALVFCVESTVIPPYSNGYIRCRMPKAKGKACIGRRCVFEPSFKHIFLYSHCKTYEGLVTVNDNIVRSAVFTIIMTNKSNRHIKIHSNQTTGMLHSCEDSQICTIHEIVTFDKNPREGRDGRSDPVLYHVPTRNPRMGRLEVNTLPKKGFYSVQINEVGPQHNYVHYRKPSLLDAPDNKQNKHDLERLLEENHDAFAKDEKQIGTTPLIKMTIDTGDHPPIAKKPYTLALKHYEWVQDEIDKLLEAGVIRESHSSWSAPIVVVPKGDGDKRPCMDFRALNAVTRTYVWPMPRVKDIFAKPGKAEFFTTLDLRSGYHHIALDDDAIKKTTFVLLFGKYKYLKVQFGLAQGPECFQNLMNKVLSGLHFTLAYLDDVIIFSKLSEQHLKHIQIVLTKLKQANLRLKKSKCLFFKQELHYLEHLLTTNGIKPQMEKIKAISEIKLPKNQMGVREILGMVGYYQKFINQFANAARPMTKLTRKGVKFKCTDECQT